MNQKQVTFVFAERNSPSDDALECVKVSETEGNYVTEGAVLFEVEGAKAIFELEAPCSGWFYPLCHEGASFPVGALVGLIARSSLTVDEVKAIVSQFGSQTRGVPSERSEPSLEATEEFGSPDPLEKLTRPAKAWMEARGITSIPASLEHREVISVIDLVDALGEKQEEVASSVTNHKGQGFSRGRPLRALLIGNSFNALQVLDANSLTGTFDFVGALADWGSSRIEDWGIPTLGPASIEAIQEYSSDLQIDRVVLAAGLDPVFRIRILEAVAAHGIDLGTVIHPSVIIGRGVEIGAGCVILAGGILGVDCHLEPGLFLSARANIEHHCHVGRGTCAGPALTLSGGVHIGEQVRIGMSVSIEPQVRVGDHAVLASGTIITKDVPPGGVAKHRPPN